MEAIRKPGTQSIKLAVAFVGLNILDAGLTVAAMSKGGVCEANPLMSHLLEQPAWVFWTTKISLTLIFALLLLIFSNKYPRQVKRIFIVLVITMAGVCLFNTMGLI